MSRLDELISELCPDGVEYKAINQFANCFPGATPKTSKREFWENGTIPWMSSGEVNYGEVTFTEKKITELGYRNSSTKMVPINSVVIALAGQGKTRGTVAITRIPLCTNQSLCAIVTNETVLSEYLLHYLRSKYQQLRDISSGDGTRGGLNLKMINSYKIPVPPLEVQREIVRILDRFAQLTGNIVESLTTELAIRKKQYEYYRNKMLTFDDNTQYMLFGDIFTFIRNGFVGVATPYYTHRGNGIRYLKGTNIHNGVISDNEEEYITHEFHQKHIRNELKADDILMVQSGHVGECAVVGEKYVGANCHALIIMSNGGSSISKFYVHYFQSAEGKRKLDTITTGGTIKHILASKIKEIVVPVPSIEEQERIVNKLDCFESLLQNISAKILAEIDARQKQYEYYRDKLLEFKEIKSS